jgi:hypothetical protein
MRSPPFLAVFFEHVAVGTQTNVRGTHTLTESREEIDSDDDRYPHGVSAGTLTATFSREESDSDTTPVSLGTITCTRAREEDDTDFSPSASVGTSTFTKEREEADTDSPTDFGSAMWECGIL